MIPEVTKDEHGNPRVHFKYDVDEIKNDYLPKKYIKEYAYNK